MKATSVLVGSAFSVVVICAILADVDAAQAQSVCTCPAGMKNLGNGLCERTGGDDDGDDRDARPAIPGSCKSAVPSIGSIVATQQQSSFSSVGGMLRAKRDSLQGDLQGDVPPSVAVMGYAPSDLDGAPGALGYGATAAVPGAQRDNPLANVPAGRGAAPAAGSASGINFGPTWATWVEGIGDWEKRSALNALDVGRTQSTYSTHAGIDATWTHPFLPSDFVVAGAVTSYTSTHVDLVNGGKLQVEGPGIGLYGMYLNGGFSADLVGKMDFLTLKEDFSGIALPPGGALSVAAGGSAGGSINITAAGVAGNVQHKDKIGWGFIEPTMGFAFSHIMFGDNAVPMGLKDGSTLRLQAGVRIGSAFVVNGVSVEPTFGLLAYSNVIADGTTLATLGGPVQDPPTDKGLLRVEANPELNFNFGDGYSAYLRGTVRAGSELVGGGAKAGFRKEF
jgi:outer membrane autotransporter protein